MTTITEPEVDARTARFDQEITRAALEADLLRQLKHHDVDAPAYGTSFVWTAPPGMTDEEKVEAARAWLARHRAAFLAVARDHGHHDPAEKIANDSFVGIRVKIPYSGIWSLLLDAEVPTEATCEMVPTGEVRTIPAQPERTEPVLERRCPESLFRGVADDVQPEAVSA